MQKHWYQSKTVWFNIALITVAVGSFLVNSETFLDLASPLLIKWLIVAVGVIGVVLRILTDIGIRLPGQKDGSGGVG